MATENAWLTYTKSKVKTIRICNDCGEPWMGSVDFGDAQPFRIARADSAKVGCGASEGGEIHAISFFFGDADTGSVAQSFLRTDPKINRTSEVQGVQIVDVDFSEGKEVTFTVENHLERKQEGLFSLEVTIQDGHEYFTSRDPQVVLKPST